MLTCHAGLAFASVKECPMKKPRNVALIIPPSRYEIDQGIDNICPNFGVLSLASCLRSHGVSVSIYDFLFDTFSDDMVPVLADYDVVGISTTADSFCFVDRLTRELKQRQKCPMIVIGGSLVSSYGAGPTNWLFGHIPADAAVIGPGEDAFLKICTGTDFEDIPQILFRANGKLRPGRHAPHIMLNLDELPFCDLSLDIPLHRKMLKTKTVFWQTARGCPFSCGFCFNMCRGDYSYTIQRVISDLEQLLQIYSPANIVFLDSTFTYDFKRSVAILREINKFGVNFSFETRVDCVSDDILSSASPNCQEIFFGMETFDSEVLSIWKKTSSQQIENAVNGCRANGIIPRGFFLLGLPGQTEDSLRLTLRQIEQLQIPCRARLLIPLPGTKVYSMLPNIDDLELLTWLSKNSDTISSVPPRWFNMSDVAFDRMLMYRDRINELGNQFYAEQSSERDSVRILKGL